MTIKDALAGIALALVMAIVMLYSTTDHRAEWQQSKDLSDAQQQAQREARLERAAAQQCARMHGNAGYRWTDDGVLVCTDHRGRINVAEKAAQ